MNRPGSILAAVVSSVLLCLDPAPSPGGRLFPGAAAAAPSLDVNPTSVDFTLMGGTGDSRTVTLTNSGDVDLDFSTVLGSPPPFGPHYPGPKLAVHLTEVNTAPGVSLCDPASAGGPAPDNVPCADFVTRAPLLTGRYLYIVVAEGDSEGIAGTGFGIDYDGEPASGIDILGGWSMCATGLQFPSDTWPAPGSGNLFTWDRCTHPAVPPSGVQAMVVGFYVYAYSDDVFRITEHTKLSTPSLKVITCANQHQYDIDPATGVGSAVFSNNGGFGANPCTGAQEGGGTPLWLSVAPTGGTISPGGDAVLELTADAAGIPPGTSYSTVLKVSSNDPQAPLQEVQVGLDVFGSPDIAVSDPVLDFGTLFVGASTALSFTVSNPGPGILIVNSLAVDDPTFSVSSTTGFNLGPGKEKAVTVTWHPLSPGPVTGTLTLGSNDPDEATATVSLLGTAVGPPVIGVSPDSVGYVLFPDAAETRTVTLSNSGEEGLDWVATLTGPLPGPGITGPKVALHVKTHTASGQCTPVSAGGAAPDNIPCSQYVTAAPLHRGMDAYIVVGNADEPGISGVAFGIEYQGAPGAGVDIEAPFYMCATGLEFPSPGWPATGEGNVLTWLSCAPTTEIPPNGIHAVAGAFYLYAYGEDTFRITENTLLKPPALKVNICGAGETILDPATDAGSIVFSDNAGAGFNPCAESPVDEGPPPWLSVNPAMGTIPPGGNALLELTADASGFDPGAALTARMRVDSNDPVTPTIHVPVALDVLALSPVTAALNMEPNPLNASSHGSWVFAALELPDGYDPADVVLEAVRVLGVVAADPTFTEYLDWNGNGVTDRKMRFDRAAVLAALPEGDTAEIAVTGKIGEQAAFVARQDVAVLHPHLLSPNGGEALAAGSWIDVTWQEPAGWEDMTTALFYRSAADEDWVPIADGITGTRHAWQVVEELSDACRIRVESRAEWGLAGFDESDAAFSITEQTPDNPPSVGVLFQNMPNPFRGSTVIGFSLPGQDRVSIRVFDAGGRRVRSLVNAVMPAGSHEVTWNGQDETGRSVASGIYFYVMDAPGRHLTKRMFLLR